MKKIEVLSLFDGISCAQVVLKSLGYNVRYYASEIDKYAIQITQKNYPNTIHVGDVKKIDPLKGTIDLLIGGSPCQDLSIAKKNRDGLKGKRSGLFYEYLRILKEARPKYFVLENVASMSREAKDEITKELGVKPTMINAALVSAQQRKRLFWTNIKGVELPEDREIFLKDIIHELRGEPVDEKYFVNAEMKFKKIDIKNGKTSIRIGKIGKGGQGDRIYSIDGKSIALSANGGGRGAKTGLYLITGCASRTRGKKGNKNYKGKQLEIRKDGKANNITTVQSDSMVLVDAKVRKLTPIECERLQSLPDNYTDGLSNTQRYKTLGNAFNVEVVKHILKNIIVRS